jgi:pyruvate dehydrogenase E2 component (dihydrolipoamide acetyltransferase)
VPEADPLQVVLPELGESVEGGTMVAWLVTVGDSVTEGQAIAEVSTDKVDTEIPSPTAGTVVRLAVEVGAEVTIGQTLCEIATGSAGSGSEPPQAADAAQEPDAAPTGPPEPAEPSAEQAVPEVPAAAPGPRTDLAGADAAMAAAQAASEALRALGARVSPLVRRRLREHAIDPTQVVGTGPGGRLTVDDVEVALETRDDTSPEQPRTAPSPATGTPRTADSRTEPLSRTRKVIAARMLESLQSTAQLTAAVEADVTRLMQLRARIGDSARAEIGSSLSPLAFIAHATVRALADHPILNASIDTDAGTVTYHGSVNLGIAVDAPAGLIVPVIRDAQTLGVVTLQQRIADIAARARGKRITPDDLAGGTFTITNTGSRGSLFDTPILNPPEVGILATPVIEKRPVVLTDTDGSERIAVRQRTYLCLSYDHRLVDGADAARFLTTVARLLDSDEWGPEVDRLVAASA